MIVKIKFYGIDATTLPSTIELPENSTMETLLGHISEIINGPVDSLIKSSIFLVNKQKADKKTVLYDNDEVHILNILGGG